MTVHQHLALAALFGLTLAGCTGSSSPTCSFVDPARLANSTWPKFRANLQNTGTVTNVTVSTNPGQIEHMFPPAGDDPKGPFIASPVINSDGSLIYIGSVDGTLYALRTADLTQNTSFNLTIAESITSTAVAALRDGQDAIFMGGGDTRLYALNATGGVQPGFWPYLLSGFISASPTLNVTDGTIYIAGQNGLLAGVCPNGITRFALSTDSIQSSPASGADGILYFGSDDRVLRAVQGDGPVKWAITASAPILAAPVLEVAANGTPVAIYAADRGGRVFKVDTSGRPVAGFNFQAVAPISSSPALAGGRLYFGSDDGNLYAVNKDDGTVAWTVATGGPIISSPAVAVGQASDVVVVVGSTDGRLYFVDDANPTTPHSLDLHASIESSPAISADGTVYVGTDEGRVYAIK